MDPFYAVHSTCRLRLPQGWVRRPEEMPLTVFILLKNKPYVSRENGIIYSMLSNREKFIDEHRALFWYTPEESKHDISDELLVETILNYGTLDDFRNLKRILTPKRVAQVFFSATGRQIGNYYPEIRNFFSLALKPYA